MQAGTIDAMAGGNRMILGVGVSGPQIVEGWYGEPGVLLPQKDYVDIIRKFGGGRTRDSRWQRDPTSL